MQFALDILRAETGLDIVLDSIGYFYEKKQTTFWDNISHMI